MNSPPGMGMAHRRIIGSAHSVGENGGGPAAGLLTSYKGKMLRLNPDGTIPTDNPFYNQTTGDLRAIYALGFVVATGLLHMAGIALGQLGRWPIGAVAVRAAGAAIALAGGAFLAGIA